MLINSLIHYDHISFVYELPHVSFMHA
jgi:hypothetical protein